MNKRAFYIFAVVFAALAIAVPIWAFSKEGAPSTSPAQAEPGDELAKDLFVTNCGACHTMRGAGTDGVVGPNLDQLLGAIPDPEANVPRVESAILEGVQGRMPAGILRGANAEIVAEYVSRTAGQ
jgi:mono/diheme cytochrome c family protein